MQQDNKTNIQKSAAFLHITNEVKKEEKVVLIIMSNNKQTTIKGSTEVNSVSDSLPILTKVKNINWEEKKTVLSTNGAGKTRSSLLKE